MKQPSTTKIQPLSDRVLIARSDAVHKSPGGILIPDTAQKKATRGEVLASGPGLMLDSGVLRPTGVMVGQVVLFSEWAGSEVPGEKDLILLRADEILGVVIP